MFHVRYCFLPSAEGVSAGNDALSIASAFAVAAASVVAGTSFGASFEAGAGSVVGVVAISAPGAAGAIIFIV